MTRIHQQPGQGRLTGECYRFVICSELWTVYGLKRDANTSTRGSSGFLTREELRGVPQLIGAWLWFLYGTIGTNTGTQQMLYGCALAFTLNGCVFLVSSLLSLRSAVMLPKLFYYTLFHLLAATCYMFGGIRAVGRTAGVDGLKQTAIPTIFPTVQVKEEAPKVPLLQMRTRATQVYFRSVFTQTNSSARSIGVQVNLELLDSQDTT
ncbi:uncharacterized protein ISCGN_029510 [Ixodes scapularis]